MLNLKTYGAVSVAGFGAFLAFQLSQRSFVWNRPSCTCVNGDACWPSRAQWLELNATLDGKLVSSTPAAAVCHDPNFDTAQCSAIREEWIWPEVHESWPGGIQSPYWQNASCDPFTSVETPCELGNSGPYAINVTKVTDVIRGLTFARKHSLRIVIKNTGHDYMGKAIAKDALIFWTHHLRTVEVVQFASSEYTGPAIRLGAGVRGIDAYETANKHGLCVLGGFCPTVGIVGGYTQGGGHGPMSSRYGLGADQVLEWEVVTSDGDHIVANSQNHTDLYWALSGGGPGTYAIALSVLVRAHQDVDVGGASLAFSTASTDSDSFWAFFKAWQDLLPRLVDAGGTAGYAVTKDAFFISPITLPRWSRDQVSDLIAPLTRQLDQMGVQYALEVTSHSSFLDHYRKFSDPLPRGPYTIHNLFGGRMIPRTVVQDNGTALVSAIRSIIADTDAFIGFVALDVGQRMPSGRSMVDNAVLPAWRDTLITALVQSTWDFTAPRSDGQRRADEITNVVVPKLQQLTPGGGTYLNEADFQLGSWREDFYGTNYQRLLAIKRKYDPRDVLYTRTGVGSENWSMDSEGRLCKA